MLYCPKTGINNKRKRWEKIETVLKERGVVFDMVQSENSDSVERLMTTGSSSGFLSSVRITTGSGSAGLSGVSGVSAGGSSAGVSCGSSGPAA